MTATIGNHLKLSLFGESHGKKIGCVLDGLPPGMPIHEPSIRLQLDRRKPGGKKGVTQRKETDEYDIVSGEINGVTTGAPLCVLFGNSDTRSQDYDNLAMVPRPGHADFTGMIKYRNFNDKRGGGHFSGRLTAPLVFAGALVNYWLQTQHQVQIVTHLLSTGPVKDTSLDDLEYQEKQKQAIIENAIPMIDPQQADQALEYIESMRKQPDSVGALLETGIYNLPVGVGTPFFGSVESVLSQYVYGIPGIKSIAFGLGEAFADLQGSVSNDPFVLKQDKIVTSTNHMGGILGGITNGMPVMFRTVMKPTSSIGKPQQSVDMENRTPQTLTVRGRHDPCIAIRGAVVVEAVTALAIYELLEASHELG